MYAYFCVAMYFHLFSTIDLFIPRCRDASRERPGRPITSLSNAGQFMYILQMLSSTVASGVMKTCSAETQPNARSSTVTKSDSAGSNDDHFMGCHWGKMDVQKKHHQQLNGIPHGHQSKRGLFSLLKRIRV